MPLCVRLKNALYLNSLRLLIITILINWCNSLMHIVSLASKKAHKTIFPSEFATNVCSL